MASPRVENKKQVQVQIAPPPRKQRVPAGSNSVIGNNADNKFTDADLGLSLVKTDKNTPKNDVKEVYLQSGRKIVIQKLSDGRSVRKYFSADGTQLKPEYFKKVEGDVKINADGKSYTVTKNGQTKTYQTKTGAEVKIAQEQAKLNKTKNEQGFIGKSWDWMKNNVFTFCDGSDKAQKQIDAEKNLLAQIQNGKFSKSYFKEVTGLDCTQENIQKFKNGKLNLKSTEKVAAFKEGQKTAVDITSDIVAGAVAYGTASACIALGIAAAPFTAGASLGAVAVGVGIAATAGAVTKVAVKKLDANSGGREYNVLSWNDGGKDAIIGGVSGALAPLTMGTGGAITNSLGKGFLANSLRFGAEGAIFGAADGGTRSALEGDDIGDIALNTIKGAGAGALAGNILGHGGNAIGKGIKFVSKSLKFSQSRKIIKENLHSGKKVPNYASDIDAPTGKLGAPSALFAETDEAFNNILLKNKYDVLYMHQKYKITGDLDDFITDMYSHYIRETDVGRFAPKLEIKSNMGDDAGCFIPTKNLIKICKEECKEQESRVAENIAHELNHWFQTKEQLITGLEGPELCAHNWARASVVRRVQNGEITTQEECNRIFDELLNEYTLKFRTEYNDLLNSTKYPHNNNPENPYFKKANRYNEADMNYDSNSDEYWNNYKEIESFRRGDAAGAIYNQIIGRDLANENAAIDMIMARIGNSTDNETKLALLELAIEHLKEPALQRMPARDFANWFLNKYTQI